MELDVVDIHDEVVLIVGQLGEVLDDVLLLQRSWNHVVDRDDGVRATAARVSARIALDRQVDAPGASLLPLLLCRVNASVAQGAVLPIFLLFQEVQVIEANLLVLVDIGEDLAHPLEERGQGVGIVNLRLDSVAHEENCDDLRDVFFVAFAGAVLCGAHELAALPSGYCPATSELVPLHEAILDVPNIHVVFLAAVAALVALDIVALLLLDEFLLHLVELTRSPVPDSWVNLKRLRPSLLDLLIAYRARV